MGHDLFYLDAPSFLDFPIVATNRASCQWSTLAVAAPVNHQASQKKAQRNADFASCLQIKATADTQAHSDEGRSQPNKYPGEQGHVATVAVGLSQRLRRPDLLLDFG